MIIYKSKIIKKNKNNFVAKDSRDITKPSSNGNVPELDTTLAFESVTQLNEEELKVKDPRVRRMSDTRGD